MTGKTTTGSEITHERLLELIPHIEDSQAIAIIATGASIREVEEALAWASGQSGVMGDLRRELSGRASAVYDLLIADRDLEENERA